MENEDSDSDFVPSRHNQKKIIFKIRTKSKVSSENVSGQQPGRNATRSENRESDGNLNDSDNIFKSSRKDKTKPVNQKRRKRKRMVIETSSEDDEEPAAKIKPKSLDNHRSKKDAQKYKSSERKIFGDSDDDFKQSRRNQSKPVNQGDAKQREKLIDYKAYPAREEPTQVATKTRILKPVLCLVEDCTKRFMEIKTWKRHFLKSHADLEFGMSYARISGDKVYKCRFCPMSFSGSTFLNNHHRTVHADVYVHPTREQITKTAKERRYQKDTQQNKRKKQTKPVSLKVIEKPVSCLVAGCNGKFNEFVGWRKHFSAYHKDIKFDLSYMSKSGAKNYRCQFCERTYDNFRSLLQHYDTEHANEYIRPTAEERKIASQLRRTCEYCAKVCKCIADLRRHIDTAHLKLTVHQCAECGKIFQGHQLLRKHERFVHKKEINFRCSICQQGFATKRGLIRHIESSHFRLKNEICTVCGKEFYNKSYLNDHAKIHEGSRQYMCHQCDFASEYRSSLRDHIRLIHENKLLYQCDICSKEFALGGNLTEHKLNAHGILPKCCYCYACGTYQQNQSTQNFHMLQKHSDSYSDQEFKILQKSVTESQGIVYLDTDDEVEFFQLNCVKNLTCCGMKYTNENFLHSHLKKLHNIHNRVSGIWNAGRQELVRKRTNRNYDETEFLRILEYSRSARDVIDERRNVYICVLVPSEILECDIQKYVENGNNEWVAYVGKCSAPDLLISQHHTAASGSLCTRSYATDNNYDMYQVSCLFLSKSTTALAVDRLAQYEATLQLKLLLFCNEWKQNRMIQKLESSTLVNLLSREEIQKLLSDVRESNGNLFAVQDFEIQFIKKIPVAKGNSQNLKCTFCGNDETFSTIFKKMIHQGICTSYSPRVPSIMYKLVNLKPLTAPRISRILSTQHLNEKFGVYVCVGLPTYVLSKDVEDYVKKGTNIPAYYGQVSGSGIVAKYHFAENIKSTVKNIGKENKVVVIARWTAKTALEMYKIERALILCGTLRKNTSGRIDRFTMQNSHVDHTDLCELYSDEEVGNIFKFSMTEDCLIYPTERPNFLPTPEPLCVDISYKLM